MPGHEKGANMKSILRHWLLVPAAAFTLLLFGCAGTVSNMKEVPADAVIKGPESGKALVIFARTSTYKYLIQSSVFEVKNEQSSLIGILAAKTKLAYSVEPGKHLFMVIGENADFLTADLKAGRTYYADVVARAGLWKARFSLEPIRRAELDKPELKTALEECRWVEKTHESDGWALSNMANVQSKRVEYYLEWLKKPEGERPHLNPDDGK